MNLNCHYIGIFSTIVYEVYWGWR